MLTSSCPSQTGLLTSRGPGPPPGDASTGPPRPRPPPQGSRTPLLTSLINLTPLLTSLLNLTPPLTCLSVVRCYPLLHGCLLTSLVTLGRQLTLTPTPLLTLTHLLTLTRLDMVGRSLLRPGCLRWPGGGTGARSSSRAAGTWTEAGGSDRRRDLD